MRRQKKVKKIHVKNKNGQSMTNRSIGGKLAIAKTLVQLFLLTKQLASEAPSALGKLWESLKELDFTDFTDFL
ncbi:MAG: hypothetical protein ACRDD9_11470 [Shewanella sp.]